MRLVLASNNPGKLAELQALFAGLGIELVTPGRARHRRGRGAARAPSSRTRSPRRATRPGGQRLPAIADDSGLCVDALGGAPGVASAHFAPLAGRFGDREAERRAQDAANNALLLERLQGRSRPPRRASSRTLVALRHADDPEPLIADRPLAGRDRARRRAAATASATTR